MRIRKEDEIALTEEPHSARLFQSHFTATVREYSS